MNKLQNCGVYHIKNIITGKIYIGSTIRTFAERWEEHRGALENNSGTGYLQKSWNKYGLNAFEYLD